MILSDGLLRNYEYKKLIIIMCPKYIYIIYKYMYYHLNSKLISIYWINSLKVFMRKDIDEYKIYYKTNGRFKSIYIIDLGFLTLSWYWNTEFISLFLISYLLSNIKWLNI